MKTGKIKFPAALEKGRKGAGPACDWLVPLLACSEDDALQLYKAADEVRSKFMGDEVHLRGLIEFSNYCRCNCRYCGLRRGNRKLERYRLSPDEITATALKAEELGYRTVVLQSGEDLWFTPERIGEIVKVIKEQTSLAVTLSVGERDENTYRLWRESGADRCLLRIETTDPALFKALHPEDRLEDRIACLFTLRELGYQLGTGVMTGLPGQTVESLARDIIWMHELGAEMIGVGPFIPHPDTPLENERGGTVEQTLRLIAVLRLVFPYVHLPATTAMGTLDPQGREKALEAGANVWMPNVTPQKVRPQYELYPNKICIGEDAGDCRACVGLRLMSVGRRIAKGRGDAVRHPAGLNFFDWRMQSEK